MAVGEGATVGRTYTTGRRQPYLIRKWPGSHWALPMGPYTVTQLVVFVGSVYLLLSFRGVWAHFGAFNLVIGVGVPVALTYATRHTRVEGRDPLRAAAALVSLWWQPRAGFLNGVAVRTGGASGFRSAHLPVAMPPAELVISPEPEPEPELERPGRPLARQWVSDLVDDAARTASRGGPGASGHRMSWNVR
jgi:hypothetical protein